MVGAEAGLADLQGAFVLGAGAGQVAQGLQHMPRPLRQMTVVLSSVPAASAI